MKKLPAQYPLRRLGRPEDVAAMVVLLASPLSSWTTGQVVSVIGDYAIVCRRRDCRRTIDTGEARRVPSARN
jgi:NAD(P)-dependent dehydrogenase (short-subunit alcohol dehydrogenase family)